MTWTKNRETENLVEWTRSDGYVTIRRRRRADEGWVVRLDRLHQAPGGRDYRRERVADVEAAKALIEEWKADADSRAE